MADFVPGCTSFHFSGFKILQESLHSKSNYRMQGPFPEWGRAPNIRAGEARNDAKAAYENALMWSITGDKAHAKRQYKLSTRGLIH